MFQELDIGIKDLRVFVGSDLVFMGSVEKGCGNQVFDYCHVIKIKAPPQSSTDKLNPVIEVEPDEPVPVKNVTKVNKVPQQQHQQQHQQQPPVRASVDKRQKRREANKVKQSPRNSQNYSSVEVSGEQKTTAHRPPASPRGAGDRSPSPAPRFPSKSPREVASLNHRSISPRINQDRKKTIRSISMSSQSSASSGGDSQPNSRPTSAAKTPRDKAIRSHTRTVNHPVVALNPGSDSMSESEGKFVLNTSIFFI